MAAGAIIPTTTPGEYVDAPLDNLTVNVYASDGADSSFELYEDSGADFGYEKGEYRLTPIVYSVSEGVSTIEVRPATGSYPGAPAKRELAFRLIGVEKPSSVKLDGIPVEAWEWANGVLEVEAGERGVAETVKLTIE